MQVWHCWPCRDVFIVVALQVELRVYCDKSSAGSSKRVKATTDFSPALHSRKTARGTPSLCRYRAAVVHGYVVEVEWRFQSRQRSCLLFGRLHILKRKTAGGAKEDVLI